MLHIETVQTLLTSVPRKLPNSQSLSASIKPILEFSSEKISDDTNNKTIDIEPNTRYESQAIVVEKTHFISSQKVTLKNYELL